MRSTRAGRVGTAAWAGDGWLLATADGHVAKLDPSGQKLAEAFHPAVVAASVESKGLRVATDGQRATFLLVGSDLITVGDHLWSYNFLELSADASKPAGALAHGQQQWLEIGMALALQPTLLLLDEPTAGMSPQETARTGDMIKRLNADGMTVLVVEHDMTFVRQIAQRVTVLHLGRVFAQGTIEEIIIDPRVAEIYLGKNHVD